MKYLVRDKKEHDNNKAEMNHLQTINSISSNEHLHFIHKVDLYREKIKLSTIMKEKKTIKTRNNNEKGEESNKEET